MKDFKGTKQEWLIDGKTVYAIHDSVFGGKMSKTNRFYCTMYPDHHSKNAVNEVEHNMRLIKSAPELLKALQRAEVYLEENTDVLAPFPTRSELDNIREAINKALGDEEV